MASELGELNDATFDRHVRGSAVPILVDFWADWCGPCKKLAPVLEDIAREHRGKIEIAKLNIDDSLEVTNRYQVLSIPTLILFRAEQDPGTGGEVGATAVVEELRLVGAKGKARILQELAPYL